VVSDFIHTFADVKQCMMKVMRAMMTPEITSGIIYVHTFETCQRSHQAIGGCTPVELYVLTTEVCIV
jgi:hypothetical protein